MHLIGLVIVVAVTQDIADFGGQLVDRLALPNSVSFAGPALLALLLVLGHTSAGERHRLMAFLAAAVAVTIIVGSAIRGLWLVTVPTLILYIVLWKGLRWVLWRRLLVAATIAAGVAPGRGLSVNPSIPSRSQRSSQLVTVSRLTLKISAISLIVLPW